MLNSWSNAIKFINYNHLTLIMSLENLFGKDLRIDFIRAEESGVSEDFFDKVLKMYGPSGVKFVK